MRRLSLLCLLMLAGCGGGDEDKTADGPEVRGPDDRLYITTGETGDDSLAQADGLNGKVLRTADFRSDGVRPEVFTRGHRNVQGIDWEPDTDRLLRLTPPAA